MSSSYKCEPAFDKKESHYYCTGSEAVPNITFKCRNCAISTTVDSDMEDLTTSTNHSKPWNKKLEKGQEVHVVVTVEDTDALSSQKPGSYHITLKRNASFFEDVNNAGSASKFARWTAVVFSLGSIKKLVDVEKELQFLQLLLHLGVPQPFEWFLKSLVDVPNTLRNMWDSMWEWGEPKIEDFVRDKVCEKPSISDALFKQENAAIRWWTEKLDGAQNAFYIDALNEWKEGLTHQLECLVKNTTLKNDTQAVIDSWVTDENSTNATDAIDDLANAANIENSTKIKKALQKAGERPSNKSSSYQELDKEDLYKLYTYCYVLDSVKQRDNKALSALLSINASVWRELKAKLGKPTTSPLEDCQPCKDFAHVLKKTPDEITGFTHQNWTSISRNCNSTCTGLDEDMSMLADNCTQVESSETINWYIAKRMEKDYTGQFVFMLLISFLFSLVYAIVVLGGILVPQFLLWLWWPALALAILWLNWNLIQMVKWSVQLLVDPLPITITIPIIGWHFPWSPSWIQTKCLCVVCILLFPGLLFGCLRHLAQQTFQKKGTVVFDPRSGWVDATTSQIRCLRCEWLAGWLPGFIKFWAWARSCIPIKDANPKKALDAPEFSEIRFPASEKYHQIAPSDDTWSHKVVCWTGLSKS